jgi:hypothetical protein
LSELLAFPLGLPLMSRIFMSDPFVFNAAIGKGAGWILEKVGFYDQTVETTESTTAMSLEAYTVPSISSDATEETTSAPAETSEETAPSET